MTTTFECEQEQDGREKVDLYTDANLGAFGLLVPEEFESIADSKTAIKDVLKQFFFPQLNIVFAASGRLRRKDNNDMDTETRLDEMEARVLIEPLSEAGKVLPAGKKGPPIEVLGIFPYDTETKESDAPLSMKPNPGSILDAVGASLGPLSGIVSGLDIVFGSLFKPSFPIVQKAFMAHATEFGWYVRSEDEKQQEGVHYGMAVLQVQRNVKQIRVTVHLSSDWKDGGVDNQICTLKKTIPVYPPKEPKDPVVLPPGPKDIPVVLKGKRVRELLGIDADALRNLTTGEDPPLVVFNLKTKDPDEWVISGGSFLRLVGMD